MAKSPRSPFLGLILLVHQVFQGGLEQTPLVTLLAIIGQVSLYVGFIQPPWGRWDVCLSSNAIFCERDYKRLIFSSFEHDDEWHLYYTMISFLRKGRTLEPVFGAKNYAVILLIFTVLTNLVYLVIAQIAYKLLGEPHFLGICTIGFSGVLFALKGIAAHLGCGKQATVLGYTLPLRQIIWIELLLIHMIVPYSAFMGHLAGILVGQIYVHTNLGRMLDKWITTATGSPYISSPVGGGQGQPEGNDDRIGREIGGLDDWLRRESGGHDDLMRRASNDSMRRASGDRERRGSTASRASSTRSRANSTRTVDDEPLDIFA